MTNTSESWKSKILPKVGKAKFFEIGSASVQDPVAIAFLEMKPNFNMVNMVMFSIPT